MVIIVSPRPVSQDAFLRNPERLPCGYRCFFWSVLRQWIVHGWFVGHFLYGDKIEI